MAFVGLMILYVEQILAGKYFYFLVDLL